MSTCSHHQFIIDEVGDLDRLPVETSRHVDTCAECARFGLDLLALRALLREPERIAPPTDFDLRVAERLRAHKAASGGAAAWASRNQRYLAAAACLVIAVTTAISYRAIPASGPTPSEPAIASSVSASESRPDAIGESAPRIDGGDARVRIDPEIGTSHLAAGPIQVSMPAASRAHDRRPTRATVARHEGIDREVQIYVQDSDGARVVSFEPVIYGAHEILPGTVASAGRADSAANSSF
jgi:hypothetical protein